MHRRHLMATALIALIPRFPLATPVAAIHARLESEAEDVAVARAFRAFAVPGLAERNEIAALNTKVWEFRNDSDAADAFADAAEQLAPEQQSYGEVYVVDTRLIAPVPGLALPSGLLTWKVVAGAAAVETSYGMVILCRDRFLWALFARSGHDSGPGSTSVAGPGKILADLAIRLSDRHVRREDVIRDDDCLLHGGLWDLLPGPADVPDGMELADQRVDAGGPGPAPSAASGACTPPPRD